MEVRTVYFKRPGAENTDEVLKIARKRAEELGIKTMVIASTRGDTALKAVEALKGFRLIIVSHSMGYDQPNVQLFPEESRKLVESRGAIVLTMTHAFAGVSRALKNRTGTAGTGEIIAETLRIFGQGMKVACEITLMAADAGYVRTDEEIITIGGTNQGADTAAVLKPIDSQNFFNLRVKEILCKPRF